MSTLFNRAGDVSRPLIIAVAAASLVALFPLSGLAQQAKSPTVPSAESKALSGARYLESCKNVLVDGSPMSGCATGTLPGTDIEQLKQEALRTKNPQLFTMLGDAYQNQRTGLSDLGLAYRWYVLAAVRGDPEAMLRLSEMYKTGTGTPQDAVKAMGYARLTEKLAQADSAAARQANQTVHLLGSKMARNEINMAEQFAQDLERQLMKRGLSSNANTSSLTGDAVTVPVTPTEDNLLNLPGLGTASIIDDTMDPSPDGPQDAASSLGRTSPLRAPDAEHAWPNVPGMSILSNTTASPESPETSSSAPAEAATPAPVNP